MWSNILGQARLRATASDAGWSSVASFGPHALQTGRDYERLNVTLKSFHYLAFAYLMLSRMFYALNEMS